MLTLKNSALDVRKNIQAVAEGMKALGVNPDYIDSVAFNLMTHLAKAEREGAIYADFGKMPVVAIADKYGVSRKTAYNVIHRRQTLCNESRERYTLN